MNLDAWLNQTVTVAPMTGRAGSGDPTYGNQMQLKARVERNVRMRVGVDDTMQNVHVMVTKDAVIVGSRVWLPGDNVNLNSAARRPLGVQTAINKQGDVQFYQSLFST